jgi:Fe-S cluster assembly protein SufD
MWPSTPRAASTTRAHSTGKAREQNRNLVLSEGTRADSVPNLEIETGDILGAGHASATGRFDDEQLFYLQARGITEREARRLVVLGFLSEIVQKVDTGELQVRLKVAIEAELLGVSA